MLDSYNQKLEDQLATRFAGKLLLRQEIPLSQHHFQHLLSHGKFISKPSMIQQKFSHICQRCHNKKPSLIGEMPCASCKKTHIYCRKCINMGRVMPCEPLYYWSGKEPTWPCYNDPCTWEGKLTPDQNRAAIRIVEAIRTNEPELLIWAVTGAGKTEMLFPGITEALRTGRRVCIATPRADVVRELLPRLKEAFEQVHIQGLYAGSKDHDGTAQLLISTTHQLLRYRQAFDVLIIDEIDAFPFHADDSLPFAAKRAQKEKSTTIYLTATPRADQLIRINNNNLPHQFVPRRFHNHPLPVPQLTISHNLQKHLHRNMPPPAFFTWFNERQHSTQSNRQLLIFVPTINLADKMADSLMPFFKKFHMEARAVHAEDPNREEKVNRFRSKQLSVLITTTILERGVTFPSVDVVVLDAGHDVFDEAALVQISGRAGRSPDDPTGEVIFIHNGKTRAMVQAVKSIRTMNRRGEF
ncbi:MAG TPA: DEAD/DEAH box helicase family protein [Virgibacillus sp.]|nr:DEAD/DEAH box helicase family protein [Virgibacillus sp.]